MPTNALPNIPKDGCEDTPDLHSEGNDLMVKEN